MIKNCVEPHSVAFFGRANTFKIKLSILCLCLVNDSDVSAYPKENTFYGDLSHA